MQGEVYIYAGTTCLLFREKQTKNSSIYLDKRLLEEHFAVNFFLRIKQIDKVQGEACLYAEKDKEISPANSQYHYQKEENANGYTRARAYCI